MSWIASSLWDLLAGRKTPPRSPRSPRSKSAESATKKSTPTRKPMQERYDKLVTDMKQTYGVRIRKWRSSMTGCAWEVHYESGRLVRLVESPYPKGPMSCAIFLHEIGHHVIGFRIYRPRCLEEYHAWKWSLDTMRELGFNVTKSVEKRMAESLRYAVAKARRRGLKKLPVELIPYAT
ncbi:MAG: hypothetical protein IIB54_16365 [Planctomycetes bacterium]|nr:hypothetical protein [Planctomycetota bacterium]